MIRRSKLSSLHHPLAMQTKMRQEFQRNWEEKERHPDEAREDVPYRNLIEIETCAVPQLDLKIIHFDDLVRLQTRHTESWDAVHKFADERMKVWSIKQSQSVLPTLLPWIESALDSLTYLRTDQEEGVILWINLPNCGVVGSMKRDFFLTLITGLMAARPSNSVCIILHANRASDKKTKRIGA